MSHLGSGESDNYIRHTHSKDSGLHVITSSLTIKTIAMEWNTSLKGET